MQHIGPRRFRWRLTVAFILVAAGASGALALGHILLVRQEREDTFRERSLREATLRLAFARETLPSSPGGEEIRDLISRYRRRGEFDVVVVDAGRGFSSDPNLTQSDIPENMRDDAPDALATGDVEYDDESFLVVGGAVDSDADLEVYFFFSKDSLSRSMSRLSTALLRNWLAVVALSSVIGTIVARRTLQPVAEASKAAQSLADGLLDTRLAVDSNDEFGAWAASFNRMAQALQTQIAALAEAHRRERRFTSDVAHELRTPLTALVTSASLVKAELDRMPRSARWPAERMLGEVGRLRTLVEELLELSRLDGGGEVVSPEVVHLRPLVSRILETRGWRGAVDTRLDDVEIHTDRRRLERVLSNLIANAVVHGRDNVRVDATCDGNGVTVAISDDGPGISPEDLPHIFDRFYKTDPARSGGSGLGLSIALENAKLIDATIEVQSRPPSGTSFTVTLPESVLAPDARRAV